MIPSGNGRPQVLRPGFLDAKTAVDVWCAGYAGSSSAKRALGKTLKMLHATIRVAPVPYLSLAIRKIA
jgi:hypothetical protein